MKEEARADKVVVNNKMEECSICQSPVTIAEKQDLLGMCSCCFDVEMMRYDRIFVIPGDDYISQSAAFRIGVATHKGNLYHYQESVRSNSNWKLYGEYHEDVDCIHSARRALCEIQGRDHYGEFVLNAPVGLIDEIDMGGYTPDLVVKLHNYDWENQSWDGEVEVAQIDSNSDKWIIGGIAVCQDENTGEWFPAHECESCEHPARIFCETDQKMLCDDCATCHSHKTTYEKFDTGPEEHEWQYDYTVTEETHHYCLCCERPACKCEYNEFCFEEE